jgi:hypothetical protein
MGVVGGGAGDKGVFLSLQPSCARRTPAIDTKARKGTEFTAKKTESTKENEEEKL